MGARNLKYQHILLFLVIAVRVTKPKVPNSIAATYEEREVERTKLLIRKEEQRLREKGTPIYKYLEAEIAKKISKIQAETASKIA